MNTASRVDYFAPARFAVGNSRSLFTIITLGGIRRYFHRL